ncbi:MAG: glycerol-3-phosphate 1-O-acyltransferase PlsY, partial [Gemmatimonadetes bacterium]|nr:glycerol-3-phosphate 1-O-acyltransferase PlsY [Gemmatimonadota bacterium]
PILLAVAAYALGATPTSYVVGRLFFAIDLRERGSGNLGATNAFRVLGWRAGVPVMVVDVLKGWVPVALFPRLHGDAAWGWALAYGAAAIFGHVYSFWVRFRGGKGVATSAGVFLALAPWALAISAVVWTLLVGRTRIVSVGSLAAAAAFPLALLLTPHQGGAALVWFATALALFVFWAHRANIRRLLRGEELRFGETPDGTANA